PPSAASNFRRPMVTVMRPSRARVRKCNDTTPRVCCPNCVATGAGGEARRAPAPTDRRPTTLRLAVKSCPLCPRKRTSAPHRGMSHECHFRTPAPQQRRHGLHDLLDHLVGGSNREKVPFAWHTLESMHAPVLECDAGADDQVLHGA